jgi:putative transposase
MARLNLSAKRSIRRVRTTFPVPVDAANLCRPASQVGELLVSDFTYIPMARGFAYFAVTLDVRTRRARGYAVSATMNAELTLAVLKMAIKSGPLQTNWIHHSDRGCQYASTVFRGYVADSGGLSSFSSPASPGENAFAESFFARFKDEVVRTMEFCTLPDVQQAVAQYIEFYNERRPHSSLGNISPIHFERNITEGTFQ